MVEYILIPKNGKGCKWYMKKDQMFKGNYVTVSDHAGYETVVDIRNYEVIKK